MRALWLADVLTDAGLTVRPFKGWETRGRDDFTPKGVMWHHTVTSPNRTDTSVDTFLATGGNATTPPPLCNYSTNRDGTVSVIAAGTANHGGIGIWNGVTRNKHWVGDEMKNAGTATEPWSGIQLEAARTAAAAVLTQIGADASWLCGHKEYAPGRKVDPHSLNMTTERLLIEVLMEDDMPLTAAEINAVAAAVWAAKPGGTTNANTWNTIANTLAEVKGIETVVKAPHAPTPVDEAAIAIAVTAGLKPVIEKAVAEAVAGLTLKAV